MKTLNPLFQTAILLTIGWLLAGQAQANRCGDADIYRGGSFHLEPFTLIELGGAKEKQLELILEQLDGQWRGEGVEILCTNKGVEKEQFKIEGAGDADREEANLRINKKYRNRSSVDRMELFYIDNLLRFENRSYTNLGLSNLTKTTLEFSVRAGGATISHSYWRVQLSKKVGSRYKRVKIERAVYGEGGLQGAAQWNLNRF